jgi:hypothetical protein
MTADASRLRFYVDENSLGLAKTLAMARKDTIHPGHFLIPEAPLGALDTVWMPAVAARNLAVIGRDRKIRTRPAEVALLRAHGLRVFWIAGKKDLTTWDEVVRLVRLWGDIESLLTNRGPGPWFMRIHEREITELPI